MSASPAGGLDQIATEWATALRAVLEGKPQPNGQYLHLVECSGNRHYPPGSAGHCCICRPSGTLVDAAEVEALRTALRPFADDAKDFTGMPDSMLICDEGCPLTVGDLRRAAAVLGAPERDPNT